MRMEDRVTAYLVTNRQCRNYLVSEPARADGVGQTLVDRTKVNAKVWATPAQRRRIMKKWARDLLASAKK